jgi:hypothetical protein
MYTKEAQLFEPPFAVAAFPDVGGPVAVAAAVAVVALLGALAVPTKCGSI